MNGDESLDNGRRVEVENAGAMQASNKIITIKMKGINPGRRRGERQWKYFWGMVRHGGEIRLEDFASDFDRYIPGSGDFDIDSDSNY